MKETYETDVYIWTKTYISTHFSVAAGAVAAATTCTMGWLRLVCSLKIHVSFAKEPYQRDDILHKRPIILRRPLIAATPYHTKRDPENRRIHEQRDSLYLLRLLRLLLQLVCASERL